MVEWMVVAFVAAAYCVVRAIFDLREKRFLWAALGILGGAAILFTPIETHAVKVDLPAR